MDTVKAAFVLVVSLCVLSFCSASDSNTTVSNSTEVNQEPLEIKSDSEEHSDTEGTDSDTGGFISDNDRIKIETEGLIPDTDESKPKAEGVVSDTDEVISETKGVISDTDEVISETKGVISDTDEVISETKGVISDTDEVISETKGVISDTDEVISETKGVISDTDEVASETSDRTKDAGELTPADEDMEIVKIQQLGGLLNADDIADIQAEEQTLEDVEGKEDIPETSEDLRFEPIPMPTDFDSYDRDEDGQIEMEELIQVTGAFENVEEVFKICDSNGNGFIDREEFKMAPLDLSGKPPEVGIDQL